MRNQIGTICLSSIIAIMMWFIFNHLVVVKSNSIDHKLLWKTNKMAQKNDYILFDLTHDLVGLQPVRVTKFIACGPGDLLKKEDNQFACNGKLLGGAKISNHKKLPAFSFNGIIPDNTGFVMGTHEDSFDSRHFGLVDLSKATKLNVIF